MTVTSGEESEPVSGGVVISVASEEEASEVDSISGAELITSHCPLLDHDKDYETATDQVLLHQQPGGACLSVVFLVNQLVSGPQS